MNSYKDLIVTVDGVNYDFNICDATILLTCSRTAGFELWGANDTLIGSEFTSKEFKVSIAGKILLDNRELKYSVINLDELPEQKLLFTPIYPINLDRFKGRKNICFNTDYSLPISGYSSVREFYSESPLQARFVFHSVHYNTVTERSFNHIMLGEGKDFEVCNINNKRIQVIFHCGGVIQLDLERTQFYESRNIR